jgi:hypothetical protein
MEERDRCVAVAYTDQSVTFDWESSICTQSLTFAVKYRFCSSHFCSRQMEREGGFGALILVYTVLVQCVSATTRARIVKWLTEIVAIQKPVKATARSPVPASIPSQRVRFHAGSNHGVGFQRLLIKMSALSAAGPEAIAADRREMPRFSLLLLHQPTERPQPMSTTSPREVQYPLRIIA